MSDLISKESSNEKKEVTTWEKTVRVGDFTKCLRVEKIENGFLVSINKYGTGEDGKYKDESKKYFSKSNPFEDNDPDKEAKENVESMKSIVNDNLFDNF